MLFLSLSLWNMEKHAVLEGWQHTLAVQIGSQQRDMYSMNA
jgi:hypothetical protein